jgi:hypothetical protein
LSRSSAEAPTGKFEERGWRYSPEGCVSIGAPTKAKSLG